MKKMFVLVCVTTLLLSVGLAKDKSMKKFQLEFLGGFSALSPDDLNLRPELQERAAAFSYDDYFDYLVAQGEVASWQKERAGDFKPLKNAFPLGLRLKYFLGPSLAISLGFSHLAKSQTSDVVYNYTLILPPDVNARVRAVYDPYTLSAKGYSPQLGLHFTKQLTGSLEVEVYAAGGPLFGECSYDIRFEEVVEVLGSVQSQVAVDYNEEGTGTGFVLDGGARLNVKIAKNFGLFVESGYTYAKIKKLSGPGSETMGVEKTTWEGDWGIQQLQAVYEWGSFSAQLPTSYWGEGASPKIRDFVLDLSGFQVRVGLFVKF